MNIYYSLCYAFLRTWYKELHKIIFATLINIYKYINNYMKVHMIRKRKHQSLNLLQINFKFITSGKVNKSHIYCSSVKQTNSSGTILSLFYLKQTQVSTKRKRRNTHIIYS